MTEEMVVDVSQDWALACDVQQGFMQTPCTLSDSYDYAGRYRQIRALGGDCFGFIPLEGDQLSLIVGDASGKALAAALMIAHVQSSLRTAPLFTGEDLATLFKVVNQQAYSSSLVDRFATLFYGVFDNATGCSLSELQATAKLRNRRYSSKRNQLGHPTVNHCSAHGTWSHAIDRCSNKHTTATMAYFRCLSPRLRMQKSARPRQVPFRIAPATGRALRY